MPYLKISCNRDFFQFTKTSVKLGLLPPAKSWDTRLHQRSTSHVFRKCPCKAVDRRLQADQPLEILFAVVAQQFKRVKFDPVAAWTKLPGTRRDEGDASEILRPDTRAVP